MTFYNYIENVRYEMFKLVNGWTREGAETKARISESLDQARREYMQMESENAKLRELAHLVAIAEYTSVDQCEGCVKKRACNAGELDMCWIRKEILEKLHELGIEVNNG